MRQVQADSRGASRCSNTSQEEEKNKTFWRLVNEKPGNLPGCPKDQSTCQSARDPAEIEAYRKACSKAVTSVPVMGAVLKSSAESAKAQRPRVAGASTYS